MQTKIKFVAGVVDITFQMRVELLNSLVAAHGNRVTLSGNDVLFSDLTEEELEEAFENSGYGDMVVNGFSPTDGNRFQWEDEENDGKLETSYFALEWDGEKLLAEV